MTNAQLINSYLIGIGPIKLTGCDMIQVELWKIKTEELCKNFGKFNE